jgi:signal transduction histidine kinase
VKFTPPGGRVVLRLESGDGEVRFAVSDDGRGISAEFLPLVFERFRQADLAESRSTRGLGLGLAIVRHLAELHGGSAAARSEGEGKGATFSVTLPLRPRERDPAR